MRILILFLCVICLLSGCMGITPSEHSSPTNTTVESTDSQPDSTHRSSVPVDSTQSSANTTDSTASTDSQAISFTLFVPNETWDGLEKREATIEQLDPNLILLQLQEANVITQDAAVLSAVVDEKNMLTLDLNEAFLMQLYSMGSTGEGMLMSSLVNTFLSAYGCESMMVIAEGEIIHSGHVDYDFPMFGINN